MCGTATRTALSWTRCTSTDRYCPACGRYLTARTATSRQTRTGRCSPGSTSTTVRTPSLSAARSSSGPDRSGPARAPRAGAVAARKEGPMNQPGVQPERDGMLQCLECGRWYRGLGSHIAKHSMTAEQYRQAHGLPMSRALIPRDLSEIHSARAKRTLAANPDLREKFAVTSSARVGLPAANRKRAQTASRPGVRAIRRRLATDAQASRLVALRQRYEDEARKVGYADLRSMLTAVSIKQAMATLGVSHATVSRLKQTV